MRIKSNKGFTLVEVVVVGILLAILALGAFSLFMLYIRETRETAEMIKLQLQSEGLMDELAHRVREGTKIVPAPNSPCSTTTASGTLDTVFCTAQLIRIEGGDDVYTFDISSGIVTRNDIAYVVGSDILVAGSFIVKKYHSLNLNWLEADITVFGKDTKTLPFKGAFQCRN